MAFVIQGRASTWRKCVGPPSPNAYIGVIAAPLTGVYVASKLCAAIGGYLLLYIFMHIR